METESEFRPASGRPGIGRPLPLGTLDLAGLFEARAPRVADSPAVIFEDDELRSREVSYLELNERSNRLAHLLQSRGVGPDTLVGICLERSPELVTAVLAVLKAGGAYVPFTVETPRDRLGILLEDAGAPLVISSRTAREFLPPTAAGVISLDEDAELIATQFASNPIRHTTQDHLACIAYTSGSSGRPKGVMVTQRGVMNRVRSWWAQWPAEPGDLQDNCVDFSVLPFLTHLFHSFSVGIPTLLVPSQVANDPRRLVDLMSRQGVTHGGSSVAFLASLLDCCPDPGARLPKLRFWRLGGGGISPGLAERFREKFPSRDLQLAYGATELSTAATQFSLSYGVAIGDRFPSGFVIPNVRVYIVDDDGNEAPPGVPGEIWVGGAGVARGYLTQPEATEERFVPHSFGGSPGERLFRTGDLGRFRPDGMLEVHGRRDHLVKIRGYRVELDEVERTLASHPDISQCVAVAAGDPNDLQLIAYVVSREGVSPKASDLGSFMRARVTLALVPSRFISVSAIPLTPNGKPDRKALPPPDDRRPELSCGFASPRTSLEELLAGIWASVLGFRQVGIRDDFLDLGGHSLAATRIAARIIEALNVPAPIQTILESRNVETLAAHLDAADPSVRLERRAELFLTVLRLSEAEVRHALEASEGGDARNRT